MSEISNLRWKLVGFIYENKLPIEKAIELVDKIEERSDAVTYAFSESEAQEAKTDLEDMENEVNAIWEQIEKHRENNKS